MPVRIRHSFDGDHSNSSQGAKSHSSSAARSDGSSVYSSLPEDPLRDDGLASISEAVFGAKDGSVAVVTMGASTVDSTYGANMDESVSSGEAAKDSSSVGSFLSQDLYFDDESVDVPAPGVVHNIGFVDDTERTNAVESQSNAEFDDLSRYLPPNQSYAFQQSAARLLEIVKDNNLPPSLFDTIMDWARKSLEDGFDFKSQCHKTLMKKIIDHYLPADCLPQTRSVAVPGVPNTEMCVFPLIPQLKRLYADKELMEGALWHYNNKKNDSDERVYGESNTSDLWRAIEEEIQPLIPDTDDPTIHSPAILVAFDDSTNCDELGRLTCQMVMCSVLNICGSKRRNERAFFPLGIIPPYPKTSGERKKDRGNAEGKILYLQFYHRCLEILWSDLDEQLRTGSTLKIKTPDGERHVLHIRLGYVIGDTKGHDDMVCHYNMHSNVLPSMVRDCDMHQRVGDDPVKECNPTVMQTVIDLVNQYLHHPARSAGRLFPVPILTYIS